ncbi:hypothetical protein C8N40_10812 [Pontibacter mucosus]|uniref:Uncharacterized protein n=2 Tax=Pontibacter TaxID=323449 RepID=A0A1I2VKJ8_9BACT|nr:MULTISPECIES: hypothetical protein [Pontibacter]PTX15125.1 hypothetical protein C8N40_10812 [Pontibacter mucosus]SFG89865.1 hypothetical protein SAMN05421739_104238 [Pontibacter chinhatensis]
MEAAALFLRFRDNLNSIANALNSKLEIRTMPYNVSIPLEIDLLADVLRLHGLDFQSGTPGLARLFDFQQWYLQHQQQADEVMQRVLEDKKAYMKTATGTVLQKEMLYRRLEFFKETAHTLEVMMIQQNLHSPKHFNYPYLNA